MELTDLAEPSTSPRSRRLLLAFQDVFESERREIVLDEPAHPLPEGTGEALDPEFAGLGVVYTLHQGETTLENLDNLANCDPIGAPRQPIASPRSAHALNESGSLERDNELLQVLDGKLLAFRDFSEWGRSLVIEPGEIKHQAGTVSASRGKLHEAPSKYTAFIGLYQGISVRVKQSSPGNPAGSRQETGATSWVTGRLIPSPLGALP
jgi:hypothetical protein